jgi:hypothetical protein
MPLLTILWSNRELIAKGLGIGLIAFVLWWYGIHIPAKLKTSQAANVELSRQVELRDSALELQGVIRREHERITREENENLRRIRSDPPPGRSGYLLLDGLLPDLYADDPADGSKAADAGGKVKP